MEELGLSYTSFNFIVFVSVTALVYFLFPIKKYQWVVLLAASYVFYLYAGYKFAVFLLFTTLSTYITALWIDKIAQESKSLLKEHKLDWDKDQKKAHKALVKRKKRAIVVSAAVINLGILVFLKFYNFFAGSLNDVFSAFQISLAVPSLNLFLPMGISFYTFQSVGYVTDVYREKISAEKNPAKVALFVSFFPQIIQGPISFYDQLAHQLYEPHSFDFTRAKYGIELVLWGFFKKLIIADRAVIAINATMDFYHEYSGTTLTFIVLLYALQLYADFSGGIDISRGVAQVLGIDLAHNFKQPYFATSINDYWRRWHISLGAWMKEYVFYPLAISSRFINLSKKIKATAFGKTSFGSHVAKVLPTSFASLIVFLLVGLWHGSNWKYVAFGLWNGGVIMLSTLLEPVFEQLTVKLHINVKSLSFRIFQIVRTFAIVFVGYVFDVAVSLQDSLYTFWRMFTDQSLSRGWSEINHLSLTRLDYLLLIISTALLFFVSLYQETHPDKSVRKMLDTKPFIVRYCILFVGILSLLILGVYGPGFDPAAFVYMQF